MALILKKDNSFRIATRHFIHVINSRVDMYAKNLRLAKDAASSYVSEKKLDEVYPDNLFEPFKQELSHVDEIAEKVVSSDLSPRYMALSVQKEVVDTLVKFEGKMSAIRGTSKDVDDVIEQCLVELYSTANVGTFVDKSTENRLDKMQSLIEDKMTPNAFAHTLGYTYFTLKGLHESVVKRAAGKLDIFEDPSETYSDDDMQQVINDALYWGVSDEYGAECVELIEATFEKNESYDQLMDRLSDMCEELYNKSINKVTKMFYEYIDARDLESV